MRLELSGTARADAAGDKVLAAMDAAMNRAKTLTFGELRYFNAAGTNIKTETRSQ